MSDNLGFEVIDRRGQPREEEQKPLIIQPESAKAPTGSKQIWRSTAYLLVLLGGPMGNMVIGRAAGLREDGLCAAADYMLPPLWPEKLDWVKIARQRLNTWLGCDCTSTILCDMHRIVVKNWQVEDTDRLKKITSQQVPEVVEVLMKVEHAKKTSKIVVPR